MIGFCGKLASDRFHQRRSRSRNRKRRATQSSENQTDGVASRKQYTVSVAYDRLRSRGSSIGLAGCGIWHFFVVIFGIWVKNGGGKRELQLQAGAGFRFFVGLGCGIRKGNRAGYGISIVG